MKNILFFIGALCFPLQETLLAQLLEKAKAVSAEVAKEAQTEFGKSFANKDEKVRLAAVDRLTGLQHQLVADSLKRALRDSAPLVRSAAALRLGQQAASHAKAPLTTAFREPSNKEAAPVLISILEALRMVGEGPTLKDLSSDFDTRTLEVQREVIRTLVISREMETVKWLAEHLDKPEPKNVDDPSNPPASFWKEKIESWTFWIVDVQKTLHDLTGKDFEEKSAVDSWRRAGGKILPRKKA